MFNVEKIAELDFFKHIKQTSTFLKFVSVNISVQGLSESTEWNFNSQAINKIVNFG